MRTQCQRPDCAEPAAVAYRLDAARQMVILDQLHGSLDAEGGALCARHAATMVLPRGWWLDDRRQAVPTLFASLKMQVAEQSTNARRRRVVAPRRSPDAPRGAVVRRRRGQPPVGEAPVIVEVPPIEPAPKPTPEPSAPEPPGERVAPASAPPAPVAPAPTPPAPVAPAPVLSAPVPVPLDGPLTIEAMVERFMAENPVVIAPVAPAPVGAPVGEAPATDAQPAEPVDEHEAAKPLWTPDFDADDDLDGLLNAKSPLLSRAFSGRSTARAKRTPGATPAVAPE